MVQAPLGYAVGQARKLYRPSGAPAAVAGRRPYGRVGPGFGLLSRSARPAVRAACTRYGGILDEVARSGYGARRCRVAVATRELTRFG